MFPILRPVTLLLALLLTCSCGFMPLMGRQGAAPEELGKISILPIADRSGQILHSHLLDDLAPRRAQVEFTLEVRLSEPRQEIAIRRDETASRISYTANAAFYLRDTQERSLFNGTSTSSNTYEATNSEFASISGQRNARDRALQEISADIRQQLAAFFIRRKSGN
jgi:hypothetical protein